MTELARVLKFPGGEDITDQTPTHELLVQPHTAESIENVEQMLQYHEGRVRVYRRWLGKQAIEDDLRDRIGDLYDELDAVRSKPSAQDINPGH